MKLPIIMGTINASPESFFKGSTAVDPATIAELAVRMVAEGAGIIDIGARSTAPYLETAISLDEEIRRMRAAVEAVRAACPSIPISADTQFSVVAEAALGAGANMVNDVSSLEADPAMASLVAHHGCPVFLMANDRADLGPEGSKRPIEWVGERLMDALHRAQEAGIRKDRIILDPGIGFFRHRTMNWVDWDFSVLGDLAELTSLGCPLLVGASRKSFLGKFLGREKADERLAGSLAVALHCDRLGVEYLRVHDVAATRDALLVGRRLEASKRGKPLPE